MADANDVLEAARLAYEDANSNLEPDQAAATSPAEARAVQDNHDAILAHYMEAMRTSFECNGTEWEGALGDAQRAQEAVEAARQAAADFPVLLGQMTALTGAVGNLIAAAR